MLVVDSLEVDSLVVDSLEVDILEVDILVVEADSLELVVVGENMLSHFKMAKK